MPRLIGMFQPDRSAALAALKTFCPHAGRDYTAGRNTDPGPQQPAHVSRLSPWIRTRQLTEWETLGAVLGQHSESAAAKFIDEVCWRSYWKGWLQLRPSIWQDYLAARAALLPRYAGDFGYQKAIEGRTGIDCFDAWVLELGEHGYLHNHARMWFASIWIHTLKLPWQLGADWFLRHLLDGDPASNTLSWRWVAGLHTRGKSYLARRDNILKYTNHRFAVDSCQLASAPIPPDNTPLPKPGSLPALPTLPRDQRLGLLVHEDDLSAVHWLSERIEPVAVAGLFAEETYAAHHIAEPVRHFRRASLENRIKGPILQQTEAVSQWVQDQQLEGILIAEPQVGLLEPALAELRSQLESHGQTVHTARHGWDATLHPRATHGFFRFKQAIPQVLAQLETFNT